MPSKNQNSSYNGLDGDKIYIPYETMVRDLPPKGDDFHPGIVNDIIYVPRSLTFEVKERVLSDGTVHVPLEEDQLDERYRADDPAAEHGVPAVVRLESIVVRFVGQAQQLGQLLLDQRTAQLQDR